MEADASYVDATHDIAWCDKAALLAVIGPSALLPTHANGTRLRAVRFWDRSCSCELVRQKSNQDTSARGRDLLRLLASDLPRRVVERFSGDRRCAGKHLRHRTCRLVAEVLDLPRALGEVSVFALGQALVFLAAVLAVGHPGLERGELLVPVLDDRFRFASGHDDRRATIGRGKQTVDAKVHADRDATGGNGSACLADQAHDAVGHLCFRDSAWKHDPFGNSNAQSGSPSIMSEAQRVCIERDVLAGVRDAPVAT